MERQPADKSGIVWIASYPKSGNTWTRAFLHNLTKLMSGEADEQDINEMVRFSTWELDKRRYTGILGFEPDNAVHRREIAATRHAVHQQIADEVEGLIFIKTHNCLVLDRGHSTINFAVTAGAIYVVRNPLDVAISYAHHSGRSIDDTIAVLGTPDGESEGKERGIYEVLGSWSQHVASWTRKRHPALYVMRYEDMLADPQRVFGGLARHLLLQPTQSELREAIARSSFERLAAQETEKGFRERPPHADQNFFREGRSGQWKEVLTPAQIERIVADHADVMRQFGYLPLA
jgi:hypothetical protein